ncbi:MAG: hypothetical protein RL346_1779 [Verrucomicrobiota bacterium]|jgi:ribose/xylose/arabinose/galactoside ABC-type transport system permease subunit
MKSVSAFKSWFGKHEFVLLLIIASEVVLFQSLGRNFLTSGNVSNLFRHSAEIGLLALVMTPVILTGGIDLSVGSLMGLCAVMFGIFVKTLGFDPLTASVMTILMGGLGGAANAGLVAHFKLPPLIVTLGTFSLFRGLAEALTRGSESYSGFSEGFLSLGNSNLGGIPAQIWIVMLVGMAIWFFVHHTTYGRALRAIGYAEEGARYAGLPVKRNVSIAYISAGLVAGLAAVILVSRLGEARANAGVGYELLAITAVVLGGVSIFGGSGNVSGTALGWIALAVLNNGLTRIVDYEIFGEKVSSVARELSGMLTGLLLIAALALAMGMKVLAARRSAKHTSKSNPTD